MDQAKATEFIKKNKHQLRQLTSLNNEVKELKGKVEKYKGIVEDLEEYISVPKISILINGEDMRDFIGNIKQKYFPRDGLK